MLILHSLVSMACLSMKDLDHRESNYGGAEFIRNEWWYLGWGRGPGEAQTPFKALLKHKSSYKIGRIKKKPVEKQHYSNLKSNLS